jgi:hypothetical protein
MKQETILETLKNICLNCLANEPSDPTEREIGYSAAMEHIVQIIDKQTNKVEKQTMDTKQRVIKDDIDKVNTYLNEGWYIVSIHTTNTTTIFLLEKDFTLK